MQEDHFSRVLVAIDGSTSSIHAIDYAISIAIKNNSELIVLYVIDVYKYPYLSSSIILAPTFGSEKYLEEKNEAEEHMNEIKKRYKQKTKNNINSKELKTEVFEGTKSVATTIIEYAESKDIDLLIIGNKGKTGFKRLLLGSVSSNIIKHAHCTVLVIR
ncbi:MAG TPA: universal stress protein [Nitrososphaeraceae archaeon]|nr:universal stress protein [Nitrososphaeraceae archaeon]